MSGEQFADLAITALRDHLEANFATELRTVETALGLEENSLGSPGEIIAARTENDNRPGLIQVFDEGISPISQREHLYAVDCTVALTFLGSVDLEENDVLRRRWVTALLRCIRSNPTLSSKVNGAFLKEGAVSFTYGDRSATRLAFLLPVEVRVHCP